MPSKQERIDKFYKQFNLAKMNHKGNVLKDQELYNLYRIPKQDKGNQMPKTLGIPTGNVYQCDVMYMPEDKKYKYVLVLADVGSGITDAEPLTVLNSSSTLQAIKTMFSRHILTFPKYKIQSDGGAEFKGDFLKYFNDKGIIVRYGKAGRSRSQALVEARNKQIAKALFMRMTAQELITGEPSLDWVDDLPDVISTINDNLKLKKKKRTVSNRLHIDKDTVILDVGTKVRVMLDKPKNVLGFKESGYHFRATDTRWDNDIKTVTNIIFQPNEPILYEVNNETYPAYTYNQLQLVKPDTEQDPPLSVIRGAPEHNVVKTIHGKKKIKGRIHYQIQWKGEPNEAQYTWEPAKTLKKNKAIKKLIEEFEETN